METGNKKPDIKSQKKKTYKKYSYQLKRKVVDEILRGILSKEEALLKYGIKSRQTINDWLNKYSLLHYSEQKNYGMNQSPAERIKELEAQVEELQGDKMILNSVIDVADELFNTDIRKKYLPQQLARYKKHKSFVEAKK